MTFDVLLVEDERVIRDAAEKILGAEGISVDLAPDTGEALEKLVNNRYNIVITDLMLTGPSGLDLIGSIRKRHFGMPIIMITGFATLENAVKSIQAGAFDFIPKPFSFEELLGVVSRAMRYIASESSGNEDAGSGESKQNGPYEQCYHLGNHAWSGIDIRKDAGAKKAGSVTDGNKAGEIITVGAGKTFRSIRGEIESIEFPEPNEHIVQGGLCVRIQTRDKNVHRVWSPLSGKVEEINSKLEEDYDLIVDDPYGRGWLIRLNPDNLELELTNLKLH